ncbi:hypothetical protein ACVXD2_000597 [Enterobacter hormaechei]|uniref:Secreted protein n=1 Tax=Enterobacter cloacae TaxID=550 RepID=A0AAW6S9T7_ENTCL|nr:MULTISPECIES: hypothetical protein [Enterobacter cloacae complex]GJL39635.1 hypothetical protein TUM17577_08440 [Enterobacter asburiae]HCD7314504.1 hypothetical protein [Enterobacter chengduensis]HED1965599.1 hypothetical protein [Enterobacter hormaechei subsp. hoffmannii]EKS6636967.1 hypothetical protein [Enterobacter hormaechei]ELB6555337.1 hypothetical protein [Enterobacter hormaechei]
MKKIIAGCVAAIVPVTSIAASVSLDTAGRCYEATRQSTQMAMLLDPNAAEYKNLNSNAKELFGTLSGGVGEKDSKKVRDAWKAILDNAGMEGSMAKSDGYREVNRYPQDVIMQEANKCVRLAIKAGIVKF